MRFFASLFILAAMLFSTGCQAAPMPQDEVPSGSEVLLTASAAPSELPSPAAATPDRMDESMTKMPERVPPTESVTPVTGEVPKSILDAILQDLEARARVSPGQVSVVQAQFVVWNDGSLGCPQPGTMYTQALVNGYWVILEAGGQKFDYRASDSGYFFLCENGFPPSTPPVTPSS